MFKGNCNFLIKKIENQNKIIKFSFKLLKKRQHFINKMVTRYFKSKKVTNFIYFAPNFNENAVNNHFL